VTTDDRAAVDALIRYAMLLQQIADLGLTLPKKQTHD
jgi:hypothetical protein